MRLEVARMVADWLAGPQGVAAGLAAVPREAGVPLPVPPAILDETRDGAVARDQEPYDLPALSVVVESVSYEGNAFTANTRFFDATVVIRYVTTTSEQTEAVVAEGSTILRAVLWSLSRLAQNDAGKSRNGVLLGQPSSMEDLGVYAPAEDRHVSFALRMTFQKCRDVAA